MKKGDNLSQQQETSVPPVIVNSLCGEHTYSYCSKRFHHARECEADATGQGCPQLLTPATRNGQCPAHRVAVECAASSAPQVGRGADEPAFRSLYLGRGRCYVANAPLGTLYSIPVASSVGAANILAYMRWMRRFTFLNASLQCRRQAMKPLMMSFIYEQPVARFYLLSRFQPFCSRPFALWNPESQSRVDLPSYVQFWPVWGLFASDCRMRGRRASSVLARRWPRDQAVSGVQDGVPAKIAR
jgi:hypothetical protein